MTATYTNPVYAGSCPDPFVLKHRGEYWAYGTGQEPDGRVFPILRSADLVTWRPQGGAMEPLPGDFPCYWAPEVSYEDGRFYLYYSVGDEATMELRVAVAEYPAGPFVDQGVRLSHEPFAIDAHVFRAPPDAASGEGRRFLFYATDFLTHERVGTGTVVDELLDPLTPAGRPRPITRALFDWQIYDPRRAEKNDARWHTLEGPFVLARKGVYYQMFSGGNWQNPSYGVGYATTRDLDTPEEWEQVCDGDRVLPVLRTVPGRVVGPGHNSVVRGPDNRQLYCVYHRWGDDRRQMAIDPLDWAGQRLFVLGPSHAARPVPTPPTFADRFDGGHLAAGAPANGWQVTGAWRTGFDAAGLPVASAGDDGQAELRHDLDGPLPFLAEVSVRTLARSDGGCGLRLLADGLVLSELRLSAADGAVGTPYVALPRPATFRPSVFHLLRVEADGARALVSLDDGPAAAVTLPAPATAIALFVEDATAEFAGFALTVGWQACFDDEQSAVFGVHAAAGWQCDRPDDWALRDGQLIYDGPGDFIRRGPPLGDYELVVNARLAGDDSAYGIAPALAAGDEPRWLIERHEEGWRAIWTEVTGDDRNEGGGSRGRQPFALPAAFDPTVDQQWRFRKQGGQLTIHWEQHEVATVPVAAAPTTVGLVARGRAAFEMVRITGLGDEG